MTCLCVSERAEGQPQRLMGLSGKKADSEQGYAHLFTAATHGCLKTVLSYCDYEPYPPQPSSPPSFLSPFVPAISLAS